MMSSSQNRATDKHIIWSDINPVSYTHLDVYKRQEYDIFSVLQKAHGS